MTCARYVSCTRQLRFGVVVIVAVLFVPLALMSIFSSRASVALFHSVAHPSYTFFVCCASFELHRVSVVISCRLLQLRTRCAANSTDDLTRRQGRSRGGSQLGEAGSRRPHSKVCSPEPPNEVHAIFSIALHWLLPVIACLEPPLRRSVSFLYVHIQLCCLTFSVESYLCLILVVQRSA